MCGILGVINYEPNISYTRAKLIRKVTTNLLKESETRGRDASGLCVVTGEKATMFKSNVPAAKLIDMPEYSQVLSTIKYSDSFRSVIGHTRAQTKGDKAFNINNHPIKAGKVVGVHNGIILNDDILFGTYEEDIKRNGRVDSEIIFQLLNYHIENGENIVEAVKSVDLLLNGSYACAFIHTDHPRYITIFTNSSSFSNISLHIFAPISTMVFASSTFIVSRALSGNQILDPDHATTKIDLMSEGMRIDTETGAIHRFELEDRFNRSTGESTFRWSSLYKEAGKKKEEEERANSIELETNGGCDLYPGCTGICHMCKQLSGSIH